MDGECMSIDTSNLALILNGLYGSSGSSSYNSLLSGTSSSSANSFQNILLAALLGGNSSSNTSTGICPYCGAVYGNQAGSTGSKNTGTSQATGTELNAYFQEAEEEYGVSADLLRAIAKVETNYNINAEGASGAQGLMQLMPAMAEAMGIEDAYNARENIMGAAKSLASKLEFNGGDVEQAVRAYHAANAASSAYQGDDTGLSLDEYVEKVLKYADQDLSDEVAASQNGTNTTSATASSNGTGSAYSSDDIKYLAELAKLQMQMQSLSAFNTSLSGDDSSSGTLV